MKKNIFLSAVLAVALLFTACQPYEDDEYQLGKAPTATDLDFSVAPSANNDNILVFTNTSKVPGMAIWSFGNGSKGSGNSATSEYPFAGTYSVEFTLSTSGGALTISKDVVISEDDLSLLEHPLYTALTGGATNLEGKTWVFDQYHAGHFGVGPFDAATPSWWAAGPNDKLECSLYTNEFTFKQVGVEMTWVNNGSVYTNGAGKDGLAALGYTTAVVPPAGDFDVAYTPAANYTFSINTTDLTITLSDGAFLGHYAGTSTYQILSYSDTEMYLKCVSTVEPGNGWWYRLIPKELNVKPVIPVKAQPLFEDFEGETLKIDFAQEAMGNLTTSSYQNPGPVPLNESSKVYLYQKKAGEFYSNISYVVSGYKFDLTNQNQITLKVFIPSYNDYVTENNVAGDWIANKVLQASVAVKLQNNELGDNAWSTQTEILKTGLEKDKWLELTFDFSSVASREDYDKIVIQFGTEGHDGGGIFFFDDFDFHE